MAKKLKTFAGILRPGAMASAKSSRFETAHARDFHPIFPFKKSSPGTNPRPDLYGARFTSDRAAIEIYLSPASNKTLLMGDSR
jgi:hypothetical protein